MENSRCVFALCENDLVALNALMRAMNKPERVYVGDVSETLVFVTVETGCCGYMVTTRRHVCCMMKPVCEYSTFAEHCAYVRTELPVYTSTVILLHSTPLFKQTLQNLAQAITIYCVHINITLEEVDTTTQLSHLLCLWGF
jgi:hypothetical protein